MSFKIRSFVLIFAIILVTGNAVDAQEGDKDLIHKAGLNYVEGFYEGDSSKLSRSLSTNLLKYGFWKNKDAADYAPAGKMSFEQALALAERFKKENNLAKPDAPKKVEIIDFTSKIAIVKIEAFWGVDYMLLAKNDDKWMIRQIIWEGPSIESNATDADKTGVERAALNYVEGFYEGDSARLSSTFRPDMYKYGYGYDKKKKEFRDGSQMTLEQAIAYADSVKAEKKFPGPDAPKEVEVLGVMNRIAAAKVTAWWGVDYILMSKDGDKWMIEQVLWAGLPGH